MHRRPNHKVRGSHYSVVFVLIALEAIFASFGFTAAAGDLEYGGIVRGKVVRAGEPLPNIKVTLEDELNQQYEPVFTNQLGVFILTGVTSGKYTLLVWPPSGQPTKSEIIAGPKITDLPSIELTGAVEAPIAPPSPRTTPVSASSITSDEARRFVKIFWAAKQTGDLDRLMAAFAPHVDYYNDGVLDRDAIRKDQKDYLHYYTQRTFELGAIDVIKEEAADNDNNAEAIRVRFSFRYHLSGKKQKSGRSVEDWLLRKVDGELQILDCKGTVIRD